MVEDWLFAAHMMAIATDETSKVSNPTVPVALAVFIGSIYIVYTYARSSA